MADYNRPYNPYPSDYPYTYQAPIPNYIPNPQPMPTTPRNYISIVPNIDMIDARQVPMDGNASVFLQQDETRMCLKRWKSDGTIETRIFVPADTNNSIIERIEKLEKFVKEFNA